MYIITKPFLKDILVKLSIVQQTNVYKYPLHRGNFANFFMVMVIRSLHTVMYMYVTYKFTFPEGKNEKNP